jgi:hypothetical protein
MLISFPANDQPAGHFSYPKDRLYMVGCLASKTAFPNIFGDRGVI